MKISIGEVVAAYKKIGFKPIRGTFANFDKKECCPISAVILSENPDIKTEQEIGIAAAKKFGGVYICTFFARFDNSIYHMLENNDPQIKEIIAEARDDANAMRDALIQGVFDVNS